MTGHSTFWIAARVTVLKLMWSEGKTIGQIMTALSAPSRGVISGKLDRLGLLGGMSKRERARRHAVGVREQQARDAARRAERGRAEVRP